MKKVLYIFLLCLVQVGCSDSGPQSDSVIVNFKTYNFETRNVSRINGGFLLVTSSALVRLNEGGDIVATFPLKEDSMRISSTNQVHHASQAFETNDKGFMIINSIVTVDQDSMNGARDSVQIDLELIKLTDSFEKEWSKIVFIASIKQTEIDRSKASTHYFQIGNFYLNFNNYGLASQDDNDDYYVAFSYDGDNRTRFQLLHISSTGLLLKREAFDSGDFYARVYAFQLIDNQLLLSRGGSSWVRFERYSKEFDVIHSFRTEAQFQNPVFSGITKDVNGNVLFTGHADVRDNLIINTNYECLVATEIEEGFSIHLISEKATRDLSFGSTVNDEGNVVMVCIRRDQITKGIGSDLILAFADSRGKIADDWILSEDRGLEGLYVHAGANTYTILGNRTLGEVGNTFLMEVKLQTRCKN